MPRWSPDGYWIAYTRLGGIDILSADTGEEAVLLEDVSASVAASLGELSGIWTIPRTGGEPRSVAVDGDRAVANFWFDRNGERLFFTRLESREADIWVVDLEGRP
jgi:Tol biopolymer transport system component